MSASKKDKSPKKHPVKSAVKVSPKKGKGKKKKKIPYNMMQAIAETSLGSSATDIDLDAGEITSFSDDSSSADSESDLDSDSDTLRDPYSDSEQFAIHYDDSSDSDDDGCSPPKYSFVTARKRFMAEGYGYLKHQKEIGPNTFGEFSFYAHAFGVQLLYSKEVTTAYHRFKAREFTGKDRPRLTDEEFKKKIVDAIENVFKKMSLDTDEFEARKELLIYFLQNHPRVLYKLIYRPLNDVVLRKSVILYHKSIHKTDKKSTSPDFSKKRAEQIPSKNLIRNFKPGETKKFEIKFKDLCLKFSKSSIKKIVNQSREELVSAIISDFDDVTIRSLLKIFSSSASIAEMLLNPKTEIERVFVDRLVHSFKSYIGTAKWWMTDNIPRINRPVLPVTEIITIGNITDLLVAIRVINRDMTRRMRNFLQLPTFRQTVDSINDGSCNVFSIGRVVAFDDNNFSSEEAEMEPVYRASQIIVDQQSIKFSFSDNTTGKLGRSHMVAKFGAYKNVITTKNAELTERGKRITAAPRKFARDIRKLLKGELKTANIDDDDYMSDLSHLTYLLFVVEPIRNPACFILNQMVLDLILAKKMTWKEVLGYYEKTGEKTKGGKDKTQFVPGKMPMVLQGSVQFARGLNKFYTFYMPHPYEFPGTRSGVRKYSRDESKQGAIEKVTVLKHLLEWEINIFQVWLMELKVSDAELEERTFDISEKLLASYKDWFGEDTFPSLTEDPTESIMYEFSPSTN